MCRQNCHLVKLHNEDANHAVQSVFVQFDVVTDGYAIFPDILEKTSCSTVTTSMRFFKYRTTSYLFAIPI